MKISFGRFAVTFNEIFLSTFIGFLSSIYKVHTTFKTIFEGRVHCFSMQVVMNKCFLVNLEKNLAQIRLISRKMQKTNL